MDKTRSINFLKLPNDFRHKFYKYLLLGLDPINPLHRQPNKYYKENEEVQRLWFKAGIKLLRTCKAISCAALPILYGCNKFHLMSNNFEEVVEFFARIGSKNRDLITTIEVDLEFAFESAEYFKSYFERESHNKVPEPPRYRGLKPTSLCRYYWQHRNGGRSTWHKTFNAVKVRSYACYRNGHGWKESRIFMIRIFHILRECAALKRLEIWFPDPQRFIAGLLCFREDKKCLKIIQSLRGLSELILHGIEELATIECCASSMHLSKLIAELHSSYIWPLLHVEAGRPSLRAYANWQLVHSSREKITLELSSSEKLTIDRFSLLPPEIRLNINEYLLLDWLENSCRYFKFGTNELNLKENPSQCTETETSGNHEVLNRGQLLGFPALLMVSKLFHREVAYPLYSRIKIDSFVFDKIGRVPCIDNIVKFLNGIGSTNRSMIQHIWIKFDLKTNQDFYEAKVMELFALLQGMPDLIDLKFWIPEKPISSKILVESEKKTQGEDSGDSEYFISPLIEASNRIRCRKLFLSGSVSPDDADTIARFMHAKVVVLWNKNMLSRAGSNFNVQAESGGWKTEDGNELTNSWLGAISKKLTPDNFP